jgi:hypothetical protein
VQRRGPLATGQRLVGRQRTVSVLLVEIGFQRLRRLVQEVARQGTDFSSGHDPLVDRIVGPARRAPIEQAQAPVGIAFAVAQVAPMKRLQRAKR